MLTYAKTPLVLFAGAVVSLLVGFPDIAPASNGKVAQLGDRPLILPSLPDKRALEAFVVCADSRDQIAVRARGNTYALSQGRWVSMMGHNCERTIAPVYLTPSGAVLSSAEGSYRVTLAAPVLSNDALTRLFISGTGARTTLEISQHTPPSTSRVCNGRDCPSFLMAPNHAVVVEGYELSRKAYVVARSFRRGAGGVRFTLIPLSFVARQREPGSVCVENVSIHWNMGRVGATSIAPAKVCK